MSTKENGKTTLLDRLKEGDETAMDEVFSLYYPRLYYFALRAIDHPMDAEDMVQESFISFWVIFQKRGDFQGSIQAYLYRSVRNRCLRHLQRQQMLSGKNGEIIERFYVEEQRRLDELAVKQELYHRASEEFDRLTPIQSQVMRLLYVDGLSVADTAEQLQTTTNNIRNHKARAVDRLKSILKSESLPTIIFFLFFFALAVMKFTSRVFYI